MGFELTIVHSQVSNLKLLVPCSAIATFLMVISFGIIGYYIFREPITFEDRNMAGSLSEFPVFFGTVVSASGSVRRIGNAFNVILITGVRARIHLRHHAAGE